MNKQETLAFLMEQLERAAEIKIKMEQARVSGYYADEPMELLRKKYKEVLEELGK